MEADGTLGRVIKAHQKLDQSRLAGAVVTDNRDVLARLNRKGDISKRVLGILAVPKAHMGKRKLGVAFRHVLALVLLDLRFICEKCPDFVDIQAVLLGLREDVRKVCHAPPQATGPVKEHHRIAVCDGMLYRSPEHKIRDVKAVHDEVAHHVVPRESEERPFGRNLLLLLADLVVRLGKFLLQPVPDRRMQP